MKTMTCKQLGGACDKEFKAETFEEMAELSRAHGMEMFSAGDKAHVAVIEEMIALMTNPGGMQEWVDDKKALFAAASED